MYRRRLALACTLLLLVPPAPLAGAGGDAPREDGWGLLAEREETFALQPGTSRAIWYDNGSRLLNLSGPPETALTPKALSAVGAAPDWLRPELSRQLGRLGSSMDEFAELIVGAYDPDWIDEMAFSMAFTSIDILASPSFEPAVIRDNARSIYDADPFLPYVDLSEHGNYTTLDYIDASGQVVELPRDIYYWHVVHPKLTDEMPAYIDPATGLQSAPPAGKFWRDYLLNFADSGYPLLRDVLSGTTSVWNGLKNSAAGNGAVGNITRWVQDVLDFGSDSERPVQPVRIYAKHLGRCGEHEDITAAAARAALIPCIGVEDIAEDHVWNEFWDGRWVQWEPVNGYIDFPESYAGWGKKFPSVNAWRGDDHQWPVTEHYASTCDLSVTVRDRGGLPVDGAVVWIGTELGGYPAYRVVACWNSTDAEGVARFSVGQNVTLSARVDKEQLGGAPTSAPSSTGMNPYALFSTDTTPIATAPLPPRAEFNFTIDADLPVKEFEEGGLLNGSYRMEVEVRVLGSVLRARSALGPHYYLSAPPRPVSSFIVDSLNYSRYCSPHGEKATVHVSARGLQNASGTDLPDGRWFAVVANEAQAVETEVRLKVRYLVRPHIFIEGPSEGALLAGGGELVVSGRADARGAETPEVSLDGGQSWTEASRKGSCWSCRLNVSLLPSGSRAALARFRHEGGLLESAPVNFTLDADDPELTFETSGIVKGGEVHLLYGRVTDNYGIARVELRLTGWGPPGGWRPVSHSPENGTWHEALDTSPLPNGTYLVSVRALDLVGRVSTASGNLTVDLEPPKIAIETLGTFRGGTVVRVRGTASDDNLLEGVHLLLEGRELPCEVEGPTWYRDWDTAGLPSGRYLLEAVAEDAAGWASSVTAELALDADSPAVFIDAPAKVEAGDTVLLSGTVWDPSGVEMAELCTDGRNWTALDLGEGGSFEVAWDTLGLCPMTYTISLRAVDRLGNPAEVRQGIVLADTTAPRIVLTAPSTVDAGEHLDVKAVVDERLGLSFVGVSLDGTNYTEMLLAGSSFRHRFHATELSPGRNLVRVRAVDTSGNVGTADKWVVMTDTLAPDVRVISSTAEGHDVVANGTVWDNHRLARVLLRIDGQDVLEVGYTNGSQMRSSRLNTHPVNSEVSLEVDFIQGTWKVSLGVPGHGKYRLDILAEDAFGLTGSARVDFEVAADGKPSAGGAPPWPWAAAASALAASAALAVILMVRRRKG